MPAWAPDFLFRPEPIVWVQHFFGLGHPTPFRLMGLPSSTWGVLFAVALALWVWGREDAYALAAVVTVEALVNLLLNAVFSVPRPSAPEIVKYEQVELDSFPSGHVFTATVLWGLLWARGRVPFWLSALIVAAVGVGRLYLGVHYLEDVLGGIALGATLIVAFRAAWPRVRRWLGRRSRGFFVAAGALAAAGAVGGVLLIDARNHFMWNAAAVFAAGLIALLIEARAVRFAPLSPALPRVTAKVVVGLIGLAPLVALDRLSGEKALVLGAALAFVGGLWALLGAPALFRWWGWGRSERPLAGPAAAGSG